MTTSPSGRLARGLALALALLLFGEARADKNPKGLNDDIKRQEHDIGEARKKLNAAKNDADAARAAAQKANAAFERASDKVGDVRRSVQAEHDASPNLVAARKQVETARAELEQLTGPILAQLQQSPAYEQAVTARERAKSRLGALPASASTQERDEAGKLYSDAIAAVRQQERAAIDGDPKAKAARAAVEAAEANGKQLIERRDQAIDQDPRLKSAKNDLDEAKSQLAKAKSKLATEAQQLANAQRQLQHEEQQKRALEIKKQQQNNNKNKNQPKKKK